MFNTYYERTVRSCLGIVGQNSVTDLFQATGFNLYEENAGSEIYGGFTNFTGGSSGANKRARMKMQRSWMEVGVSQNSSPATSPHHHKNTLRKKILDFSL